VFLTEDAPSQFKKCDVLVKRILEENRRALTQKAYKPWSIPPKKNSFLNLCGTPLNYTGLTHFKMKNPVRAG
jgi:hypothetical protein